MLKFPLPIPEIGILAGDSESALQREALIEYLVVAAEATKGVFGDIERIMIGLSYEMRLKPNAPAHWWIERAMDTGTVLNKHHGDDFLCVGLCYTHNNELRNEVETVLKEEMSFDPPSIMTRHENRYVVWVPVHLRTQARKVLNDWAEDNYGLIPAAGGGTIVAYRDGQFWVQVDPDPHKKGMPLDTQLAQLAAGVIKTTGIPVRTVTGLGAHPERTYVFVPAQHVDWASNQLRRAQHDGSNLFEARSWK